MIRDTFVDKISTTTMICNAFLIQFNDIHLKLNAYSQNDDTDSEERDLLIKTLKAGLIPYLNKAINFNDFTLDFNDREEIEEKTEQTDHWNYWVYYCSCQE